MRPTRFLYSSVAELTLGRTELTGIYNRGYVYSMLSQKLEEVNRHGRKPRDAETHS
jgi:hypothetical protein